MMQPYDWESHIKTIMHTLGAVGLWPPGDEIYEPGLYTAYSAFVLFAFLFGHIFFQAANIYFIRSDLEALTGTVYVLLVEMIVVLKVDYMIRNMAMIKQLLNVLKTDMFQPTNEPQISAIRNSVWFWKLIYRTLLWVCIGTNMFWAVYPLFDGSAVSQKRLPFLAWYPFDTKRSPVYEITYVYQVLSVSIITTLHINIDAFVAALNVFNGNQFDILCDNLRNLHRLRGSISENFVACVRHHQGILSFAEKSNTFLNWILLTQFMVFSFCIGMTMFQLTVVPPLSTEFYSLVAYGLAITIQIFMYCWFGNEMEVKSGNITHAIFQSDWPDFSLELKKNVLFFLMRARKPVRLSAFNVFSLSLGNFLKILKTSYSYFALLNQVSRRP